MSSMELFELLGSVSDKYLLETMEEAPEKGISRRRILLVAVAAALALLLMGCTVAVAYAQGWFPAIFAARTETPLTDSQIEFIENNEQIIAETVETSGWQVELKSTLCDSGTGYILFGITAPEEVDLEGIHDKWKHSDDWQRITPGNEAINHQRRRTLLVPSCGNVDTERNFIWQTGGRWEADNDGKSNTLNYLVTTYCEKLDPGKDMLLEDPFGSDVTFNIRFLDFIYEYKDPEVQKAIDEKYAGMTDYMVADEDMEGLYKAEVLVEGTWEFDISFADGGQQSIELITGEPVMTWGLVTWKLDDDPTFYETGSGIAATKIVSFVLSPFGATITYEFEEPAFSAFIQYPDYNGYEDRSVYAVMTNGSRIRLYTWGTGDKLTAESPIVLSEVDHILLGDGVTIPVP